MNGLISLCHSAMHRALNELQRLRKNRAKPAIDLSIQGAIKNTATEASRAHKRLGELIQLWELLVPADLASHTSLTSLRSGVLHVDVDSSSVAFELDRLLRSGLTDELRQTFRGTLSRVKTRTVPTKV